ncbi:hypothetical protein AMS59_04065 [Lysinibacillus sp. FJAT-14745]|uniref:hypothetical protein n=1 Tax=Lysinibacillus sp. FJAT-14745 TaxID=1704289 RepID=UPI0006ABB056|nr:hypothetical protein [Lysinibacillus sp. FJAT-14745]KOP80563.1 hypothetical protein AMS59_04065 [Lysinibacillus sp. FJAT-14745]
MDINKLATQLGISVPDINTIRQTVVTQAFENNIGVRALVLLSQYPFLIIGPIAEVVSDYLVIEAEITNITELDGEKFRVHIDDIEVFYIEKENRPIPDIRNGMND